MSAFVLVGTIWCVWFQDDPGKLQCLVAIYAIGGMWTFIIVEGTMFLNDWIKNREAQRAQQLKEAMKQARADELARISKKLKEAGITSIAIEDLSDTPKVEKAS